MVMTQIQFCQFIESPDTRRHFSEFVVFSAEGEEVGETADPVSQLRQLIGVQLEGGEESQRRHLGWQIGDGVGGQGERGQVSQLPYLWGDESDLVSAAVQSNQRDKLGYSVRNLRQRIKVGEEV